ncbi:MAG: MarR family transcriptional regulator [Calditrichaeota bacterium]|nr:MAG: MarR family transcriptional regulator [Calditrichota bacterium]
MLPAEVAARSAWHWLRLVIKSQLQYDAFVMAPEQAQGLSDLAERLGRQSPAQMCREFLHAALAECFHPHGALLLVALADRQPQNPLRLAEQLHLSEPTTFERLARLLQLGLVERRLEEETYQLTESGQALAGFLAEAEAALRRLVDAQLPELLGNQTKGDTR